MDRKTNDLTTEDANAVEGILPQRGRASDLPTSLQAVNSAVTAAETTHGNLLGLPDDRVQHSQRHWLENSQQQSALHSESRNSIVTPPQQCNHLVSEETQQLLSKRMGNIIHPNPLSEAPQLMLHENAAAAAQLALQLLQVPIGTQLPLPISQQVAASSLPTFSATNLPSMNSGRAMATSGPSAAGQAICTNAISPSALPLPVAPPRASLPRISSVRYTVRQKNRRTYRNEPFPEKLRRLVQESEDAGLDDVVSWIPCGNGFKVHQLHEFESIIIPKYFRHGRMSSLRRQLSMYGFRRLFEGENAGFRHELFHRDRPELCKQIKRVSELEIVTTVSLR